MRLTTSHPARLTKAFDSELSILAMALDIHSRDARGQKMMCLSVKIHRGLSMDIRSIIVMKWVIEVRGA